MTEDNTEALLPGLGEPPAEQSALEAAARRSLHALNRAGVLREEDALLCQLILELAQAVDAGRESKKASAAAMAAVQLREAFNSLPRPVEGGDDDEDPWSQLVEDLRAAGRSAAVRDEA